MNIEKLRTNKIDNVLADFIAYAGVQDLVDNATFNRGDFFEMAITHEPVKRNGLHGISQGDFVMNNGLIVEIKYLTKKTGASKDMKGTIATHYLIGFNTGKEIELRLIEKSELVTIQDGKRQKITYQNNMNKGLRITL